MRLREIEEAEGRAVDEIRPCSHADRDPVTGALGPPSCDSPCTLRCDAGGDCGISRCAAHAFAHSHACDHRWVPAAECARDVLRLAADLRRAMGEARRCADALDAGAPGAAADVARSLRRLAEGEP